MPGDAHASCTYMELALAGGGTYTHKTIPLLQLRQLNRILGPGRPGLRFGGRPKARLTHSALILRDQGGASNDSSKSNRRRTRYQHREIRHLAHPSGKRASLRDCRVMPGVSDDSAARTSVQNFDIIPRPQKETQCHDTLS